MTRNQVAVDEFLSEGLRACDVGMLPRYYCELLTWALHRYLEREGWSIVSILGYHGPEPVYIDVNTGDESCNLLSNGRLLIEKGDYRFVVTVDINPMSRCSVKISAQTSSPASTRMSCSGSTETAVMILTCCVWLAIFTANCNGAGIIRMLSR